ncbi:MAG: STAS/SEC14 domain-containing protein [Planctomycetes bacterium]|nr:STAS/SEC14 domain-containing protein [Planctomycetota bacterium]MCB9910841.1 STAS/SEC14 domain-containing protein [Planctomycetota bacterium]MCB9912227.1 STAS/SEC14 domain-containing protein [Planctomycetota bacterium]HPF13144.1 STAS/SEC14 domain-containing protein [Planctomycetota bacterium]HRV81680.1 STAS/SEC14 domain-containing protein [Planctomycetota bacterium]
MSLELKETESGKLLEVVVSGKLTHADYQEFVPKVEALIQTKGKPAILFEMVDFHGWELSAAWDDFKFGLKHFADISRLAMVGDKRWEMGMAAFCRPFTTAKVRYFDRGQRDAALAWALES